MIKHYQPLFPYEFHLVVKVTSSQILDTPIIWGPLKFKSEGALSIEERLRYIAKFMNATSAKIRLEIFNGTGTGPREPRHYLFGFLMENKNGEFPTEYFISKIMKAIEKEETGDRT